MPNCPECGLILDYGPEIPPYEYYICKCGYKKSVKDEAPQPPTDPDGHPLPNPP